MKHRILSPQIFPGLLGIRPPTGHNPEPPWMIEFGWIELVRTDGSGARAIVETAFDAQVHLTRSRKISVWRAVRRGPALGDRCAVVEVCDVAVGPASGAFVAVPVRTRHRSDEGGNSHENQ
jgi:hypothetical protein